MKVLALITFLGILSAAVAQSCVGRPNGTFLADSKRCNYYYSCNNGIAVSLSCPSGFHFNAQRQACDYPTTAGCVKCPREGFVNLAVAGACRKFIQCFKGVATERECPKGLLFDSTFAQCNLEQLVRC
ncbi:probable endochitinase [Uranotaenia lowii]|uniref:probable endochitinase n=1 Tax=Uranotaenia lowii TaxID=190385 RepID=UPI00247B0068|nr:probable endochitinase [Uranotaenia lowii]